MLKIALRPAHAVLFKQLHHQGKNGRLGAAEIVGTVAVRDMGDLITVAANWPESRKEHWITLLRSRAMENQCYIAGVNRIGIGNNINYSGNSLIIDPLGKIIGSTEEGVEDILIADIDRSLVSRVRNSFKVKEDRRESLYHKLQTIDKI